MNMKLILFDCDGTLVDSQHNIARAMREAYAALGVPYPGDVATRRVIGLSLVEAIARLSPDLDRHTHERLARAYKEAFLTLRTQPDFHEPMFPGALETLKALAERDDVLLGIATGKARRGLDVLLDRFGIRDLFVTLQTADDAPSKPHPGMILRAMEETGAAPRQTLIVGDTTHDMLMARNAGIAGLGVAWGYHPADELRHAGAHDVAETFREVPPKAERLTDTPAAGAAEG
jgi:phosphoglycolate phosphatase